MEKIRDLTCLSDILPTGFHGAVTAKVGVGSTVYVAGAGPVGLAAAASARILGAAAVQRVGAYTKRAVVGREAPHQTHEACFRRRIGGHPRRSDAVADKTAGENERVTTAFQHRGDLRSCAKEGRLRLTAITSAHSCGSIFANGFIAPTRPALLSATSSLAEQSNA